MDAAAAVAAAELADIKAALAERQEYRQVRHVPCQSPELAISACVTASELPAPRQWYERGTQDACRWCGKANEHLRWMPDSSAD